jgi:hypothetical protein
MQNTQRHQHPARDYFAATSALTPFCRACASAGGLVHKGQGRGAGPTGPSMPRSHSGPHQKQANKRQFVLKKAHGLSPYSIFEANNFEEDAVEAIAARLQKAQQIREGHNQQREANAAKSAKCCSANARPHNPIFIAFIAYDDTKCTQ